ncbi:uncharacterized protein LOC115628001 [Scaptodrosophila lebanonensis]|uniref:Uncharacterized protein LOC115628001 n=1 Tax=Drosophila lebanonensis TaxID=7225 RepID=A0A6J2TXZ6_DROLE|nr:uncharacterized protein LOC115628001 [Scaptodrosophila lebanonensis]
MLLGSFLMLEIGTDAQLSSQSTGSDLSSVPRIRTKRGIFWDFFQKMFITKNLIVDQYTDTRNTLNDIYNTVNEQFSDPAPAKPTNRPRSTTERLVSASDGLINVIVSGALSSEDGDSSEDPTTTTEAYKISRYELGRILGRNFRGIQRLTQTEFREALNATHYNLKEYKAEADKQFANSLAVEKKNKIKSLKG